MILLLTTLLLLALVNGAFIIGFWQAAQPSMVLEPLNVRLRTWLPPNLYKPMLGCYKCMASVHGTWMYAIAYFWLLRDIEPWLALYVLIHIPVTSTVSQILRRHI